MKEIDNQGRIIRHHPRVFFERFKPTTNAPLPLVSLGIVDACYVWSVRELDERTISAGVHPEAVGYYVTRIPHLNVPIHFRDESVRRDMSDMGLQRGFARIVRRMRFWFTHNLDRDAAQSCNDQLCSAITAVQGVE